MFGPGSVWVLLATPASSTFLTVGGAEGAGLWISVLLGFVGVSSRLLTLNLLSPAFDVTGVGVANTCRLKSRKLLEENITSTKV